MNVVSLDADAREAKLMSGETITFGNVLLATLAPWAFDFAIRHLPSRPATSTALSARDRLETNPRSHSKPATQGDPQ